MATTLELVNLLAKQKETVMRSIDEYTENIKNEKIFRRIEKEQLQGKEHQTISLGSIRVLLGEIISFEFISQEKLFVKVYEHDEPAWDLTRPTILNVLKDISHRVNSSNISSYDYKWKGLKKEITIEEYRSLFSNKVFNNRIPNYIKTYEGNITKTGREFYMTLDDIIREDFNMLKVTTRSGKEHCFVDGKCAFNIYDKFDEISAMLRRVSNIYELDESFDKVVFEIDAKSDDSKVHSGGCIGERVVDYALKWLPKEKYIIIEGRSTNKYGHPCIILKNDAFIDECQEYDHIIVGPQGVFVVETKNYAGIISIDKNGNWVREKDGEKTGERNPLQQMDRHTKLLKSIVKDIEVNNILCLAHPKVIINGVENSPVTILKSDVLCHYIENFKAEILLSDSERQELAEKIYLHMI